MSTVSVARGRLAAIASVGGTTDVLDSTTNVVDRSAIGISRVTADSSSSESESTTAAAVSVTSRGLPTVTAIG